MTTLATHREAPSGHATASPAGAWRAFARLVPWLVAVALIAALWLHSRNRCDFVALMLHGGRVQGVASDGGRVFVVFSNLALGPERTMTLHRGSVPREEFAAPRAGLYDDTDGRRGFHYLGFAVTRPAEFGGRVTAVTFVVPHAGLLAATLLLAARDPWHQWRRRRRAKQGRCVNCGYDLRGTSGMCPECGTAR